MLVADIENTVLSSFSWFVFAEENQESEPLNLNTKPQIFRPGASGGRFVSPQGTIKQQSQKFSLHSQDFNHLCTGCLQDMVWKSFQHRTSFAGFSYEGEVASFSFFPYCCRGIQASCRKTSQYPNPQSEWVFCNSWKITTNSFFAFLRKRRQHSYKSFNKNLTITFHYYTLNW